MPAVAPRPAPPQRDELRQQALKTLQQQAQDAQQQAQDVQLWRVDELQRVLDATAADTTANCKRNLRRIGRDAGRCFASMSSVPVANASTTIRVKVICSTSTTRALEIEAAAPITEPDTATPGERPKTARPQRRTSLDHLPHNLHRARSASESEKTLPWLRCAPNNASAKTSSRELEFTPAKLEVNVHVPPWHVCSKCRDGVASPPVPSKLVKGGNQRRPGAGPPSCWSASSPGPPYALQARRYLDPTRRASVAEHLVRLGQERSRPARTKAALQKTLVLQSPVLWTDDIHVLVLGGAKPTAVPVVDSGPHIGDSEHPYSVYDFTMSRTSCDGPATFLAGYQGFLQADAYGGYDGISSWAPAARSWRWLALLMRMRGGSAPRRAVECCRARRIKCWSGIQQMYDVEDRAADMTAAERQRCGSESRCRSSIESRDIWMSCRRAGLAQVDAGQAR